MIAGVTLPDRWTKFARSVRFNVWLFLIVAVASSIGTFLPQNKPAEEALAKVGPFWAGVFERLGFFDIYHTWWFAALLGLMAFDVVACKLRGLPKLIHGPFSGKTSRKIHASSFMSRARLRSDFSSKRDLDAATESLRGWFRRRKLQFRESEVVIDGPVSGTGVAFFAGRQRVQRWGDFILHVSLVVVLAGNLLGALFGFEEMLPIVEGKTVEMKNRPFQVTLKDFHIEYYAASGAPSLYASDLLVTHGEKTLADQRIIVNYPLDLNRVRFYQASWGMTETFRSATLRIAGQELTVKPNEVRRVEGTPFSLRANRFFPSFDVDTQDMPYTRDYEGRNPALQVDFLVGNEVQGRVWLLKDHPDVAFGLQGPHAFRTAPPPFQLTSVDPVLFSGIQVGYDPGAPIFWFGSLLLLIGLSIHFYLHQRRLRVLVAPAPAGSNITVGGWSSRAPQDFKAEFDLWTDEMRGAVGQIVAPPREPA